MNEDTVRALNSINRRFYERAAAPFARSRRGVWRGWRRLLELFLERRPTPISPRVLDAGCGNARFAELLDTRLAGSFDYLGIDASAALLEEALARTETSGCSTFLRFDLVTDSIVARLGERRFDLVVALGLMHHVPGLATRQRLLGELCDLTASGGMLAVSFWDFRRVKRLRERIVPWERLVSAGGPRLIADELEPDDHLLGFGEEEDALRYCHFASLEERERLFDRLPLDARREFRADGREGDLNHYLVGVRRPSK